jgi:hypothetical protein
VIHAALTALLLGQWLTQGMRVNDEGVVAGYATQVNCVGTGVACASNGTVWTLTFTGGSGGGAPTDAKYLVMAADPTLTQEAVVPTCSAGTHLFSNGTAITCTADAGAAPGGSSGNLQTNNGSGGFGAYAGATCTAPNVMRILNASGAVTCYQIPFDGIANPTGDSTFTFPSGTKMLWTFTGSTDNAFSIHGDGAFTGTGDLVHIHKSGTGSTLGADALHIEVDSDLNMAGLRITMANASRQALATNAVITASGGFVGALTGTATALAANGSNCGAGQYAQGVDASGAAEGCATPPGTYVLPDATSLVTGGVRLTGDLGGTATSPTVPGLAGKANTTHVHAASDVTSGTLAGARGGGGAALPTCAANEKLTSNGTTWSCATDLNTGATGSANYLAVLLDFGSPESDDLATTVVTGQTWVTANSRIMCAPTMHATTSRAEGAEDAVIEGLAVSVHSKVVGTGFTVTAASNAGLGTTGVYQIVCSGSDDWAALTASVTPATADGACTGVGSCGTNTNYVTCSGGGGTGAYSFGWTIDDGTVTISNDTSATTRFGASGSTPSSLNATATCTVSDGVSTATKTVPVSFVFDVP